MKSTLSRELVESTLQLMLIVDQSGIDWARSYRADLTGSNCLLILYAFTACALCQRTTLTLSSHNQRWFFIQCVFLRLKQE